MNVKKKRTLSWIDIILTLASLEVMSYFYYGVRTLIMAGLCMAVSFVCDWIAVWFMKKKYVPDDLMSLADGLAIALMMPASVDFRIPMISCAFAVLVGKNLFGGRKNIIFSPCAVGYLFALTSWGNKILMYPSPDKKLEINAENAVLSHSLSYYFNSAGNISISDFDLLIGNFRGAMGTVSILLLVISAFVLVFRKAVSAGAFTGVIAGIAFMAFIVPVSESRSESLKYIMATNMFLFSSVYIVSDKRVAPLNNYYAFFYGLFTAVTAYIIILTTAKENMIPAVSVIMTPVALLFKSIQLKADKYASEEKKVEINEKQNY
ncbi:MAG: RnfABCDGE type electron transport complex subunit D [Oscillospiraceae bacterium]|nr:RnfABCDGE type electron transport complex subunit D [Oscillospiraceae bacterium]